MIASKSPIAVQATKKNIIYSMEHTNQEGLDQIVCKQRRESKKELNFFFVLFQRDINRLNLLSEDFVTGCMAQVSKGDPPVFAKL